MNHKKQLDGALSVLTNGQLVRAPRTPPHFQRSQRINTVSIRASNAIMGKIYHVMTLPSDVNAIQVTSTRQSKNLSRYISVLILVKESRSGSRRRKFSNKQNSVE
jgi:hypothetical protein